MGTPEGSLGTIQVTDIFYKVTVGYVHKKVQ